MFLRRQESSDSSIGGREGFDSLAEEVERQFTMIEELRASNAASYALDDLDRVEAKLRRILQEPE